MRYADLKENDIVDGKGVCVSLWMLGCPHRCPGCHNPETWDFNGGKRNFSILGGEPLCSENREYIADLLSKVRKQYPDIKIYIWTGYVLDQLLNDVTFDYDKKIFSKINYLIDGPFIQSERDLTLELRGSKNQCIIGFIN